MIPHEFYPIFEKAIVKFGDTLALIAVKNKPVGQIDKSIERKSSSHQRIASKIPRNTSAPLRQKIMRTSQLKATATSNTLRTQSCKDSVVVSTRKRTMDQCPATGCTSETTL